MFDLSQRTALVTGASGGIGGAIARAFHKNGATVALSGTRTEALEALAKELGGERVVVLRADLSNPEDVERLAKDAEQALGRIDILVNNAGLTKDGLILRMKDEDWSKIIDVNLTAAFRLCRAAAKGMMKRRFGRILNMASIVAVTGNPGQTNYVSSKAGLIGLTKSLALEVASRGITVNAIAPGFIASPMTDALSDDQKARLLERIPASRMGDVADIGAAALYLASDEASYVTGQTLHVNGGMAMI